MSTSTDVVPISDAAYVDASRGNLNCALAIRFNQKIRVTVGDYGEDGPMVGTEEYFHVSGGKEEFPGARYVMSFNNLVGQDRVWIRAESGDDSVILIPGDVVITGRM